MSVVRIQMHCALETRYIRYIVVNQRLNPLQISYRPVTPVTSLSINNLGMGQSTVASRRRLSTPLSPIRFRTQFIRRKATEADEAARSAEFTCPP